MKRRGSWYTPKSNMYCSRSWAFTRGKRTWKWKIGDTSAFSKLSMTSYFHYTNLWASYLSQALDLRAYTSPRRGRKLITLEYGAIGPSFNTLQPLPRCLIATGNSSTMSGIRKRSKAWWTLSSSALKTQSWGRCIITSEIICELLALTIVLVTHVIVNGTTEHVIRNWLVFTKSVWQAFSRIQIHSFRALRIFG